MIEVVLVCVAAAAVVAFLVVLSAGVLVTAGLIASLWVTTRAHTFWRTRLGRRVDAMRTPDVIGRRWGSFDSSASQA